MRESLSPATRRAYAAQWNLWCAHCLATGITPLPASPEAIANWLAQRATHGAAQGRRAQAGRSGHSLSTLRQATSAIRLAHLAAGHAFDPRAPAIHLVLKGVARAKAELPGQAAPLRAETVAETVGELLATVTFRAGDSSPAHKRNSLRAGWRTSVEDREPETVSSGKGDSSPVNGEGFNPRNARNPATAAYGVRNPLRLKGEGFVPRDARDAAMLALGYCFALRRSELAGLDFERLGSGTGTLVITPDCLEVRLARSKRNDGQPARTFVVPTTHNRLALDAIKIWLTLANIAPGEPVLRRVFKSGRVGPQRLDPQSIPIIIKQRLAQAFMARGMTAGEARAAAASYSGHSLRVGFAVTAAEAGSDAGAIQRALGHKTPHMAARYSRAAHLSRMSPHRLPGVGLEPPRKTGKRGRGRSA
ncbi:MAG: tyrosine-type recombinase/integrase [Hyphomicrobiaceae bacterium]